MRPEPYWAALDWKALAAFVVMILTIATPYLIERRKGRSHTAETSIKQGESAADRVERVQREQYERVRDERDYYATRLREVEAEKDTLAAEQQECWDAFDRCYDHGRTLRHTAADMLQEMLAELRKAGVTVAPSKYALPPVPRREALTKPEA